MTLDKDPSLRWAGLSERHDGPEGVECGRHEDWALASTEQEDVGP